MSIFFGGGTSWLALSQSDCERTARDKRLPGLMRLRAAAEWKCNRIGHAEFHRGELAQVLATDKGPLAASRVANLVKQGRDLDIIGQESTANCLVLPHWVAQKDGRGTSACSVHGVRRRAA